MNSIRYRLARNERVILWSSCREHDGSFVRDGQKIWEGRNLGDDGPYGKPDIFLNILERKNGSYISAIKVKLFLPNGDLVEGWTDTSIEGTIEIVGYDNLLDGRFNA